MKILDTFLQLTKQTYPHGTEDELRGFLPKNIKRDEFGNYFLEIGKTNTMFTSHLDTASYDKSSVTHVITGDVIRTDGRTILGADDKAGVTLLLWMIEHKIPGLYYFFLGEERGCVGSSKLKRVFKERYPNINKVVSFDRRGTTSIITHQSYGRTASDEFAQDLSNRLNGTGFGFFFRPDPTGIYTDSNQFASIVEECTNISVGYQAEHSRDESQSISHLEKLAQAIILIDWESLTISRKPGSGSGDWDDDYSSYWGDYSPSYGRGSSYGNTYSGGLDLFDDDLDEPEVITKNEIESLLIKMDITSDEIIWDGSTCYLVIDGQMEYFGSLEDIEELIRVYSW